MPPELLKVVAGDSTLVDGKRLSLVGSGSGEIDETVCTSLDEDIMGDVTGSDVEKSRRVIVVFPQNVESELNGGGSDCGEGACVSVPVGVAVSDKLEGTSMMYRKTDTVYSSSVALPSSGPVALFRLAKCVVAYTVMLTFVIPYAGATPEIERLLTSRASQETGGSSSIRMTVSAEVHSRGTKSIAISLVRKVLITT